MALNRPTKAALQTSEKLVDRALCVGGALLFSQAPEFMQQYLQRLGGHLAEAQRHLAEFQRVAAQSGQTLDHLIATSRQSADVAIAKLGDVMQGASARVAELSSAEVAIRDASPLTRPFEFVRHLDPAIVHDTWSIFLPAVPTTLEGVIYAAVGMVFLLGVYHGLVRYPVARVWQRRQARKLAAAGRKPAVVSGKKTAPV